MTSPTFIATFADGEVTRMSVFTQRDRLNHARGVRLARIAYESRCKHPAPAIIEARYEHEGSIVETYDAEQLGQPRDHRDRGSGRRRARKTKAAGATP